MGKHRSETNQQNKNKILFGGIILVVGWMFVAPTLKQAKVAIELKGIRSY